jgi:hypothetical protein
MVRFLPGRRGQRPCRFPSLWQPRRPSSHRRRAGNAWSESLSDTREGARSKQVNDHEQIDSCPASEIEVRAHPRD